MRAAAGVSLWDCSSLRELGLWGKAELSFAYTSLLKVVSP